MYRSFGFNGRREFHDSRRQFAPFGRGECRCLSTADLLVSLLVVRNVRHDCPASLDSAIDFLLVNILAHKLFCVLGFTNGGKFGLLPVNFSILSAPRW
jgi:hypothetical protein